jgi:5-methylcytosine-specific restriction endonuclease McrA
MSNEVIEMPRRETYKVSWQRNKRRQFKEENGYSMTAHYGAGRNRKLVLERDSFSCVKCGMTDAQHKAAWNRPITIDHKDKDRTNNTLENLQTLCLKCHGNKDLIQPLRAQIVPAHKAEILARRESGETYQQIADALKFSIASIWKWCKRWDGESK